MNAHQPVLLAEVLEFLAIKPNGIYVDATFGRGGHATAILNRLDSSGRLFVLDKDPEAVRYAKELFADDPRVVVGEGSFTGLSALAKQHDLVGKIDGILFDLGVSSPQLETPERGFSFLREGPLDMRMDPNRGISAFTWINTAREAEIATVLKEYGEERHARRMARAIVEERMHIPIKTTIQLANIVTAANASWERHKHPATRAFQAIRIFINNELNELSDSLEQCLALLAKEGRLVVLSFHSLEDRIVKRFMRSHARSHDIRWPQQLRLVKRAIKPTEVEMENNVRARSAVLRVAEKVL